MLTVAAVPTVLPGHAVKSETTMTTHAEALVTATEVIAALPGCCASEVQGEMVGLVFLLLLSLVGVVDSKVKTAALKALRGACSAAHDDRVVQDGCAHALSVLNDSLGKERGACL